MFDLLNIYCTTRIQIQLLCIFININAFTYSLVTNTSYKSFRHQYLLLLYLSKFGPLNIYSRLIFPNPDIYLDISFRFPFPCITTRSAMLITVDLLQSGFDLDLLCPKSSLRCQFEASSDMI